MRVSRTSPLYAEAEADPVGFWMSRALDELTWYREPTQALDDSNPPFFKWFADGELNASVNCLDATSRPAAATRPPTSGSASPATSA